jgi:hypothetical protein
MLSTRQTTYNSESGFDSEESMGFFGIDVDEYLLVKNIFIALMSCSFLVPSI